MLTISWDAAQRAALAQDVERVDGRALAIAAAASMMAFVVGGVVVAGLWAEFADPPYAVVAGRNAYQDAEQLGGQFGIDVAFVWACLAVSLPLGALAGLMWHRVGWPVAVVLIVAAGIASLIAWKLGTVLGPDDPRTLIAAAADGDRLYQRLELHAKGLLLTAPVGALLGFICAIAVVGRPRFPHRVGSDPARG